MNNHQKQEFFPLIKNRVRRILTTPKKDFIDILPLGHEEVN